MVEGGGDPDHDIVGQRGEVGTGREGRRARAEARGAGGMRGGASGCGCVGEIEGGERRRRNARPSSVLHLRRRMKECVRQRHRQRLRENQWMQGVGNSFLHAFRFA